jgi:hypothetical protein
MPLGTKGTDPVAIMMFLAEISLSGNPTFPYLTFCFPCKHKKHKYFDYYKAQVTLTKIHTTDYAQVILTFVTFILT